MTQKEFDIAMKRFTRFLKDNGYYKLIMSYLFPPGRTKQDMLNALNGKAELTIKVPFSYVLGYTHVIGPSYQRLGQKYWDDFIRAVHNAWVEKCKNEYTEYDRKLI